MNGMLGATQMAMSEKSVTFYANTRYSGRKKRATQDKIYFQNESNLFGPPPPPPPTLKSCRGGIAATQHRYINKLALR